MMKRIVSVIALCLLLGTGTAQAGVTLEAFKFETKAEEQHFKDLIEELRCLVCQNQSLADSDAELAHDLRAEVYDMIQAGNSDDEIVEFLYSDSAVAVLTGRAGSGKSTSLAAMIGHINETRQGHIVTIEDPVEFVHAHKQCMVTQREIGADTTGFKSALRSVLRQDPDFVLVGEDSSLARALPMATRVANANARKRQDDTRHIPQAP